MQREAPAFSWCSMISPALKLARGTLPEALSQVETARPLVDLNRVVCGGARVPPYGAARWINGRPGRRLHQSAAERIQAAPIEVDEFVSQRAIAGDERSRHQDDGGFVPALCGEVGRSRLLV